MSDFHHRKIAVRCYCMPLCGEVADPYTVVFSGRYRHLTAGMYVYLCMSSRPAHPQGVGVYGEAERYIDNRGYGQPGGYRHLGKAISFDDLPVECQKLVMSYALDLGIIGVKK